MSARSFLVGTRGSPLAVAQTNDVIAQLQARCPGLRIETRIVKTSGDRESDQPLATLGGKGVFVQEIDEALLRKEVDFAVHSLKDLPTARPLGLLLAAIPLREDPHDALVLNLELVALALPEGAQVATSSLRRRAQLLAWRPDLEIVDIRGNIDTRIRKLHELNLHAIVLAEAGLRRLGFKQNRQVLPYEAMLPAPGQGALALECRSDDAETLAALQGLDHAATRACVEAERALLHRLEGGCNVPLGALAEWRNGSLLHLQALIASPDGAVLVRDSVLGSPQNAEQLGRELADALLSRGGGEILDAIRANTPISSI